MSVRTSPRKQRRSAPAADRNRIEALEPRRLLAVPGTLDASFSGDGKVTVPLGFGRVVPYTIDAADVAVQADGKTVIAGTQRPADNNDDENQRDFAVVRFNVDGTLDQTFGDKGIFFVHLGKDATPDERVTSLAIGLDGKIVVAGMTRVERTLTQDTLDFAVIRLLPNGVLDNTFDEDGYRTIQFDGDTHAIANDVAVRSDGTIILVGETRLFDIVPPLSQSDLDFAIAILNVDGSLQSQGRRVFGFGGDQIFDSAQAVTIGAGGNIIVVGRSTAEGGSFAVARLLPNGDFDTTFGSGFASGGRQRIPLPDRTDAAAMDVLAQGDKIVVVGKSVTGVTRRSEMIRLLANGQLDTTFNGGGNGGVVETPGLNAANAIIPSADGGLIVGGEGSGGFVIAGYTANGVLNTAGFGTGGLVTTPFNETTPVLTGLARAFPSRRFVATGGPLSPVARYLDVGANVVRAQPLFDATAGETAPNPASFFVFRDEKLPAATKVFFSITGTATFNVAFGSDYAVSGMSFPRSGDDLRPYVIIPLGQTYTQVTISAIDDTLREGTETAVFTIVPNPATYEIGAPSVATLAILDNDSSISRTVGTFTATTPDDQVVPDETLQTTVTWTVPTGGWRQLSSIQLRLTDLKDDSVAVLLRFDEGSDSFVQENSPAIAAGDSPVSLLLAQCSFAAAGPTAPTVTVTFTWRFTATAAKRRFALDVAAYNDIGERDGFSRIARLHVHKPKGDALVLRPDQSEEEWWMGALKAE
jgi:uncharacterized delta-60 repeat protein